MNVPLVGNVDCGTKISTRIPPRHVRCVHGRSPLLEPSGLSAFAGGHIHRPRRTRRLSRDKRTTPVETALSSSRTIRCACAETTVPLPLCSPDIQRTQTHTTAPPPTYVKAPGKIIASERSPHRKNTITPYAVCSWRFAWRSAQDDSLIGIGGSCHSGRSRMAQVVRRRCHCCPIG